MLHLKASILCCIALVISATSLWADSYQCTFKPRHVEQGLVPETMQIDWPNYLKPPRITDSVTQANGLRNVTATVPIENSKRVTFVWRLPTIPVPYLSRIVGGRISRSVKVDYRATVFHGSGKVILSARPLVAVAYASEGVRAQGRCKVIK